MAIATKTDPAETKKRLIDTILKKKIEDEKKKELQNMPLIDIAIMFGESYMQEIVNAMATLNEAVLAQIRKQGATPCLVEQKKIIDEILRQIETKEITSETLRILLQKLKMECKE